MEIIKCSRLGFTYPKSDTPALSDVSFSLNQGELCVVIGKSASGKSTLLKLLKKEIAPFGKLTGDISVLKNVGYVSQNFEEMIVTDNVYSELSFAPVNAGLSSDKVELLVAQTAAYFNLDGKLDKPISELSGGEKQLLNLASVMIMKPDVLVLDEPTSQLDPVSSARFLDVLRTLHKDFSTSIIIAEHNVDLLFENIDSILLLDAGKAIKKPVLDMINYLFDTKSDMLFALPVYTRLYKGAKTLCDCKKELEKRKLTPVQNTVQKGETSIKIKNLSFSYDKGNDILKGLNLEFYKGNINAVIGPNSSGKTTLLKVISGVKKQYRGSIKKNGSVSMLCQNPFDLFTKEKCEDETLFGDLTAFLEIDDIKERHPYDISGGQAQRLALSKVLSQNADIILLDEPTKGFDCVLKKKLAELLRKLSYMGKTVVIVSHDIEFVGEYADFVSFLSGGKIVATNNRRDFFSTLSFYTTAVSKLTENDIVSVSDLVLAGGLDE